MNRDILEGKWKQIRGDVKRRWGKLTDDELDQVAGNWDRLSGRLQERYGYAKMDAERELDAFLSGLDVPAEPAAARRGQM